MIAAIIAASFIQTSPAAPDRCDTIEIVHGDPFMEVHYVNSALNCSYPGVWVVELDGVRVQVQISIPRDNNYEEVVKVTVLDDLPISVEPSDMHSIPDNGEPVVFTLIPMMF